MSYFTEKQRTLFLIDSIGALITGFSLLLIIGQFNGYFGMPASALSYLSIIAFCFCIYSAICFFFVKANWTKYMRVIGIANLFYCVLTIVLLIKYFPLLTMLGTSYFLIEIAIILGISYVELNVAKKHCL